MKKKSLITIIVIAGVVAVILLMVGMARLLTNALMMDNFPTDQTTVLVRDRTLPGGSLRMSLPTEPYIGIVNVQGIIEGQRSASGMFDTPETYQHNAMMEYINSMMDDPYNVAILLNINSPGGTVYEAEELLEKLQEYQTVTGRPVWAYMNQMAASGGYLVAASADVIYANQNTITGSIAVIISGFDLTGLYEMLGIHYFSVVSGQNKDMTSPDHDQLQIYQVLVDEIHDRFVEHIISGRNMSWRDVEEIADGRIFSASQALDYGLIDEISSFEDMVEDMRDEFGNILFYEPEPVISSWAAMFGRVEEMIPRSNIQIGLDIAERFGQGVPLLLDKRGVQ